MAKVYVIANLFFLLTKNDILCAITNFPIQGFTTLILLDVKNQIMGQKFHLFACNYE